MLWRNPPCYSSGKTSRALSGHIASDIGYRTAPLHRPVLISSTTPCYPRPLQTKGSAFVPPPTLLYLTLRSGSNIRPTHHGRGCLTIAAKSSFSIGVRSLDYSGLFQPI